MANEESGKERLRAAQVLRRLHDLGAINLDVLVSKSAEIRDIAGMSELEPGEICYPLNLHIGPRGFDLVSVANEFQQLGFEVKRIGKKG